MDNEIMVKMENMKKTAEFLMENNIPAFITDIYGTYYFGEILLVGDIRLTIINTEGKRKGIKDHLIWSNIKLITDKKEREVEE